MQQLACTPPVMSHVCCPQNNMAAAAAALANSLGAAGMANHGSNSNPLLSQYAALLGMGRQAGAGPGQLLAQPAALHLACCSANVLSC